MIQELDWMTINVYPWLYTRRKIIVEIDSCGNCPRHRKTRHWDHWCEEKRRPLGMYWQLEPIRMMFFDGLKIPEWCPGIDGVRG